MHKNRLKAKTYPKSQTEPMKRAREMESESMEWENPVAYWQQRSRQALESQGVVVPPPRPVLPVPRNPVTRCPRKLPPGVVNVRQRLERIGLDLICNYCEQHIPKSERMDILCHFYATDGPRGSPLTRCFVRCTNCYDELVLGRNISDADNFVVIAGATQHFPDADAVPNPDPNLQNEAYPDAVLDSANDLHPHVIEGVDDDEEELDDDEEDDMLESTVDGHQRLLETSWYLNPPARPLPSSAEKLTMARTPNKSSSGHK